MLRAGFAIPALLMVSVVAWGQVPLPGQTAPPGGGTIPTPGSGVPIVTTPPPQPAAPLDPVLKAHLEGWERVMQGATNFYSECTLVRKNTLLRKETAYTGSILSLKPNLARMNLKRKPTPGQKEDPNDMIGYICTGQAVYEYDGLAKQVTEFKLRNGGIGDNLLLEFISGALKAKDVADRFDLKQLQANAQHYVYLEIKPRLPKDKAEFESMILVLFQPNLPKMEQVGYLPRTVVIRKNNGQEEETWDFPQPVVNAGGIKADSFQYVPPPKDWKVQPAQTPGAPAGTPTGQPRVVRPNGS